MIPFVKCVDKRLGAARLPLSEQSRSACLMGADNTVGESSDTHPLWCGCSQHICHERLDLGKGAVFLSREQKWLPRKANSVMVREKCMWIHGTGKNLKLSVYSNFLMKDKVSFSENSRSPCSRPHGAKGTFDQGKS